jgi:hypothetical protein
MLLADVLIKFDQLFTYLQWKKQLTESSNGTASTNLRIINGVTLNGRI